MPWQSPGSRCESGDKTFPPGYRTPPLRPEDQRDVLALDSWGFPTGTDLDTLVAIGLTLHWDRYVGVVTDAEDPDAVPIDGAPWRDAVAPKEPV